jgi:hypothetical protein
MTRLQLYELAWSAPLTALAPRFGISDVALKKTCAKFDIPVPPRGYWAKLQSGKRTNKVALPPRGPGMDNEVVIGGRNRYWYGHHLTNEEILGPLPNPPSFPEDIELVRDRVRKSIGKIPAAKVLTLKHPVIERLLAEDEARRQRQLKATYTFSSEAPVFDSPFEQRRLRFLNALFLAVARCGGKPVIEGRGARDISVTIHQTRVAVSLDRPPTGRRKAARAAQGPDRLRFAILAGYDREDRASWEDGEGGRLERFIQEIAVAVVTAAEISYRESCVSAFEWRAQRKADLEEAARNRQLQIERAEQERQQRLEQTRVERLLDEAASLRRATDIRAYVDAVSVCCRQRKFFNIGRGIAAVVKMGTCRGSSHRSRKKCPFYKGFRELMVTQINCGSKCGMSRSRSKLYSSIKYLFT